MAEKSSVFGPLTVPNTDWQTSLPRIKDRNAFMFTNPLMSDVAFTVRKSETDSGEVRIPAHKFVLAISSPVFYAMFYGDMAEQSDCIHLPDCHEKGFLQFLRYLYSDQIDFSAEIVLEILYLSKKYIVPHLSQECLKYLEKGLNHNNVFEILKQAKKFDEGKLVEKCWQLIDDDTLECIRSEGILQINRDILSALIERDTLNVEEVDLFKAAKQWAEAKCMEADIEPTGPEMRRMLGDAIFHFRFPVMKPEEFAEQVAPTQICLDSESLAVLVYLNSGSSIAGKPVRFCKNPRKESLGRIQNLPLHRCGRFKDSISYGKFKDRTDKLVFQVRPSKIYLFGVRLYAGSTLHYCYEVHVKLTDENAVVLQTQRGCFTVEQRSWSPIYGFDVMFEKPQLICPYTNFTIKVTIVSPTGKTVSYNGLIGCSEVVSNEIHFNFIGDSDHILELLYKAEKSA